MKKKIVIVIAIVGLLFCLFFTCSLSNLSKRAHEKKNQKETQQDLYSEIPEVLTDEEKDYKETQKFFYDENSIVATTEESYKEILTQIALKELGIGFNVHAVNLEVEGNNTLLITGVEGNINAMFAKKQFLETHKVEFVYDGQNQLEEYTPPTYESIDGYQEHNYEYVFEKDISTHVGIRGFDQGVLTLRIDDTYIIIINQNK